jgi:hypothetical protein
MIQIVGRKNKYMNPNQTKKYRFSNQSLQEPQKAVSAEPYDRNHEQENI